VLHIPVGAAVGGTNVRRALHNDRYFEPGFFRGTAEVDEADISGRFEGSLIARQKLTIRKGGRIDGSVRYGRIVIESGGEISGDMAALEDTKEPVGAGALDR